MPQTFLRVSQIGYGLGSDVVARYLHFAEPGRSVYFATMGRLTRRQAATQLRLGAREGVCQDHVRVARETISQNLVVLDYWLWLQGWLVPVLGGGGKFAYYAFDDLLVFGVSKPIFAILPVWRR